MKSGILKHPYLGDTRTYASNNRQLMEFRTTIERNPEWFKKFQAVKDYEWKLCLFPIGVAQDQDPQFSSPIPKKYPVLKVTYSGYYVTSLRDEIMTRAKNHAKFSEAEILYIIYSIVNAWREWKQFCKSSNIENQYTAISSSHVLFNQEGDIKLITPLSSPLPLPSPVYYAPELLPPNQETPTSWNKSIAFCLGLIGAEMVALKIADPLYQYRGTQLKFLFDDYVKWLDSWEHSIAKEIYNLIVLMTDPNPWVRLKFGELEAMLAPYHKDILDGKQSALNRQQSRASLLEYLKSKRKASDP